MNLVLLSVLLNTFSNNFFVPCSRNDPRLNDCVRNQANRVIQHISKYGAPELNIDRNDPTLIDPVEGMYNENYTLVYTSKLSWTGMSGIKIKQFFVDLDNKNITFIAEFPRVCWRGDYWMNGSCLGQMATGNGHFETCYINTIYTFQYLYELVTRADEEYARLRDTYLSFHSDKIVYNYTNLFDGDQYKADLLLNVINESWEEYSEIVSPLVDRMVKAIHSDIFHKFFSIPFNKLFKP